MIDPSMAGLEVTLDNFGGSTVQVFPIGTAAWDGFAPGAAFPLAPNSYQRLRCSLTTGRLT